MANVEFDTKELDEFSKDLLKLAQEAKGKETKRFMKNEGRKLAKKQKEEFLDSGAGAGTGVTEEKIKKSFKGGKVFKKEGDLAVRGYSSHPLTHLLEDGYTHKGGKNKTGKETFVPGYHFIDKSAKGFEDTYYDDTEKFLDKLLLEHNL